MFDFLPPELPADRGLYIYETYTSVPDFISYDSFPHLISRYADFYRRQGVMKGTAVAFPFETSPEIILSFLALLHIGAIPFSIKPLLTSASKAEYESYLQRITKQFHAQYVLATPSLAAVALPATPLHMDDIGAVPRASEFHRPARHAADDIAFVQFSSGSTSFPKGIPITWGALRENINLILRTDKREPGERVSSWLPLYHDMGLVGGLLSSLSGGNDLLLSNPLAFLADPFSWWKHMAAEHCIGTAIPNFAVDYSLKLMESAEQAEIAELDLSAIRSIYLGSEPINIENLRSFLDLMAPAKLAETVFMPCYGMAEAVLLVSSRPPRTSLRVSTAPSGVPAISLGKPVTGFTVRVSGKDGQPCADGELGEIQLAGGTLAASYFGSGTTLAGPDGFYRTGDIGFLHDGELFVTGRISDRIKVNGQSLFSADFEHAIERLPFVRDGRTAVIQSGSDIVILAEVDLVARNDVAGSRTKIAEHLIQTIGVTVHPHNIHYIRAGQLLRTSSGKLQRQAIREAYEARRLKGLTLPDPLPQRRAMSRAMS